MTLTSMCHPTIFVNTTTFLVDKESFSCLHEVWLSIFVKIEVSIDLMRVEVIFLDTEWSGNLTSRVHVWLREHESCCLVFNNVASIYILQITSLVCQMPLQITCRTILVTEHKYVSFIVTVEFAKNVIFVESSEFCVGRDVNFTFELFKAAQDLIGHLYWLVHFRLRVSFVFRLLAQALFFFFPQSFELIFLQLLFLQCKLFSIALLLKFLSG